MLPEDQFGKESSRLYRRSGPLSLRAKLRERLDRAQNACRAACSSLTILKNLSSLVISNTSKI